MTTRTEAVLNRVSTINELSDKISKHTKQVENWKQQRTKLQNEALELMRKEGVDKLSSIELGLNVTIKTLDVPVVSDFMTFWKFVKKKDAPEFLMRKCNSAAWREHDMNVPGIGIFSKETLSITKRRS